MPSNPLTQHKKAIIDRLKAWRSSFGISGANFVRRCDSITRHCLVAYEHYRCAIPRAKVVAISNAWGISLEWLETGNGNPGSPTSGIIAPSLQPTANTKRGGYQKLLSAIRSLSPPKSEAERIFERVQLGLEGCCVRCRALRGQSPSRRYCLVCCHGLGLYNTNPLIRRYARLSRQQRAAKMAKLFPAAAAADVAVAANFPANHP